MSARVSVRTVCEKMAEREKKKKKAAKMKRAAASAVVAAPGVEEVPEERMDTVSRAATSAQQAKGAGAVISAGEVRARSNLAGAQAANVGAEATLNLFRLLQTSEGPHEDTLGAMRAEIVAQGKRAALQMQQEQGGGPPAQYSAPVGPLPPDVQLPRGVPGVPNAQPSSAPDSGEAGAVSAGQRRAKQVAMGALLSGAVAVAGHLAYKYFSGAPAYDMTGADDGGDGDEGDLKINRTLPAFSFPQDPQPTTHGGARPGVIAVPGPDDGAGVISPTVWRGGGGGGGGVERGPSSFEDVMHRDFRERRMVVMPDVKDAFARSANLRWAAATSVPEDEDEDHPVAGALSMTDAALRGSGVTLPPAFQALHKSLKVVRAVHRRYLHGSDPNQRAVLHEFAVDQARKRGVSYAEAYRDGAQRVVALDNAGELRGGGFGGAGVVARRIASSHPWGNAGGVGNAAGAPSGLPPATQARAPRSDMQAVMLAETLYWLRPQNNGYIAEGA